MIVLFPEFAAGVLERGPTPRSGNKSDQAHPPIHPLKYTNALQVGSKAQTLHQSCFFETNRIIDSDFCLEVDKCISFKTSFFSPFEHLSK